ncbi:mechanosensitive ion channel family protein [Sphingomonas glacialis]|uniref:Small-conductance mechanosensitive channel n=1 Tax=Sphingomonas glacialis TaxID=658225 RepID=A0A502FFJ8_9SPHN|nr:mechanosensitive ion channel [Sphingomonas glacialis]TPG48033.1 mechanosensitive ion channel family protein [Sphingomonas glacialis]
MTRSSREFRRLVLRILLAVSIGGWTATPTSAEAQADAATVRLDGQAIFQVGPASEGEEAGVRARRVEARLEGLLRNPRALGVPTARHVADGWAVTVSGVSVVSLTPRDAEDNFVSSQALATQWATALDQSLRRARARRSGWGGQFLADIRASAESAFGRLEESAVRIIPRIFAAMVVIGIFWLLARAVRVLLRAIFRRTVDDITVESLIKQLSYYAILAVGFFVAGDALGFDPTTVAAGLGLTGLVLGFALKDILSNFVSGLLLLLLRPFKIGDQIVVGDLEGAVERIELRATKLRAYDGRVMLVPNAEVFTSRIVNNTADPVRRGRVTAWVGYDTDLKKAIEAARSATMAADGVLASPPPAVRVDQLGQDDIVLEITFWSDSQRSDFKNTASAVRSRIVAAFKRFEIGLPDPDVRVLTTRAVGTPSPVPTVEVPEA